MPLLTSSQCAVGINWFKDSLGMIDSVHRMHVEGNTDAWPNVNKLDELW